jgi:c-di-GMP-binding flagellar brake protein YcgR
MQPDARTKTANRRISRRRKVRKSVKVECRNGALGLGLNLALAILDLSDTGACLVVAQNLPGPPAQVEIILNGMNLRQAIKRLAYVRWLVKTEAGQWCAGFEFQQRLSYRDWQDLAAPS